MVTVDTDLMIPRSKWFSLNVVIFIRLKYFGKIINNRSWSVISDRGTVAFF